MPGMLGLFLAGGPTIKPTPRTVFLLAGASVPSSPNPFRVAGCGLKPLAAQPASCKAIHKQQQHQQIQKVNSLLVGDRSKEMLPTTTEL